nr:MAG TPA: hypothetical protein [Caudoviricetes sp.]
MNSNICGNYLKLLFILFSSSFQLILKRLKIAYSL